MKMDDCRKCKYHFKSQLDGILCEFSGGFDYHVMAQDKKGNSIVVMCPLEMPVLKKEAIGSITTMAGIS